MRAEASGRAQEAVADALRHGYGWRDATVVPGSRGATAQVLDVRVGVARYALKVGRRELPSEAAIAAERASIDRARAAGVRMPVLHAGLDGRAVQAGPDGSWLRAYDWVDAVPVELGAPGSPAAVGELLARLHRSAPSTTTEVDGGPPDRWYERPPALSELDAMLGTGAWWVPRLAERMASLPGLVGLVEPSDPARLVLCHRDLHPGNVVVDGQGGLVVLDQDDLGPADPARELARAMFDWWSDPRPHIEAIRTMYEAYITSGGPARVREPADLTMLVATRLNFLLRQLHVSTDRATSDGDRAWADQEIDESLRILPTVEQVAEVLAALGA